MKCYLAIIVVVVITFKMREGFANPVASPDDDAMIIRTRLSDEDTLDQSEFLSVDNPTAPPMVSRSKFNTHITDADQRLVQMPHDKSTGQANRLNTNRILWKVSKQSSCLRLNNDV